MADQVKVQDVEVFRLLRAAMLKYTHAVNQSLANSDSEIGRMHGWLEGEQMNFWQGQLRKRTEAVTKARDVLRGKKMFKNSAGKTPDTSVEEKALAQCIAAVEQAERKIKAIRTWLPKLEKAGGEYRGGVSGLNRAVSGEIPQAVALLDRLAMMLEEYTQLEAPVASRAEAEVAAADGALAAAEGSMARADGGAAAAPAAAPDAAAEGQAGTTPAGEAQAQAQNQVEPRPIPKGEA